MSFLSALSIVCGLMLHVSFSALNTHYCVPRKTVPYQNELKLFKEEGIFNYSTMLMRDDLGVLLLGAREAVYALDIDNVSVKKAAVYWRVTEEKQRECWYKGKHAEVECRNYIRTLHKVNDTTMFVCGTNAFSPSCDYMTFVNGQLRLEGKQEEGKGKCPFDPFQRYSSLMVGECLSQICCQREQSTECGRVFKVRQQKRAAYDNCVQIYTRPQDMSTECSYKCHPISPLVLPAHSKYVLISQNKQVGCVH